MQQNSETKPDLSNLPVIEAEIDEFAAEKIVEDSQKPASENFEKNKELTGKIRSESNDKDEQKRPSVKNKQKKLKQKKEKLPQKSIKEQKPKEKKASKKKFLKKLKSILIKVAICFAVIAGCLLIFCS